MCVAQILIELDWDLKIKIIVTQKFHIWISIKAKDMVPVKWEK